jgi:hypothetical protein
MEAEALVVRKLERPRVDEIADAKVLRHGSLLSVTG